jgi:hypothetical protein
MLNQQARQHAQALAGFVATSLGELGTRIDGIAGKPSVVNNTTYFQTDNSGQTAFVDNSQTANVAVQQNTTNQAFVDATTNQAVLQVANQFGGTTPRKIALQQLMHGQIFLNSIDDHLRLQPGTGPRQASLGDDVYAEMPTNGGPPQPPGAGGAIRKGGKSKGVRPGENPYAGAASSSSGPGGGGPPPTDSALATTGGGWVAAGLSAMGIAPTVEYVPGFTPIEVVPTGIPVVLPTATEAARATALTLAYAPQNVSMTLKGHASKMKSGRAKDDKETQGQQSASASSGAAASSSTPPDAPKRPRKGEKDRADLAIRRPGFGLG